MNVTGERQIKRNKIFIVPPYFKGLFFQQINKNNKGAQKTIPTSYLVGSKLLPNKIKII